MTSLAEQAPPLLVGQERQAAQRPSHNTLMRRRAWYPLASADRTQLDAIVVPAARRAHRLKHIVDLAAASGTPLVVLASHHCQISEVADMVASAPGCKALIVAVPDSVCHEALTLETSAGIFRELSAGRRSNLSLKRNLGLLLARLRGWRKIMFVDDDILPLTIDTLRRVAYHLETNLFAGLRTVKTPDNSVVCHANRLVGQPQGIFVSGAALGVHTADLPLEVFPDVYNEDWFAMAGVASNLGVVCAGEAHQLEFNPYDDPNRAAVEEFGDLLAEGLFAAMTDGLHPARTTTSIYWASFIEARSQVIERIDAALTWQTHQEVQAKASLIQAMIQLKEIRPDHCVDFIEAWRQDRDRFGKLSATLRAGTPIHDAMAQLRLSDWRLAEFGNPHLETIHLVS